MPITGSSIASATSTPEHSNSTDSSESIRRPGRRNEPLTSREAKITTDEAAFCLYRHARTSLGAARSVNAATTYGAAEGRS
jgi:hypothetical protein